MIEYPKISVIVPIYNTANLLNRSVSSILNQTYQNLECILVDDGSTDDSYEVCLQLQKSDKRIILLRQENKGQGAARNLALDYATGDYIAFVDSDDFIEAEMYEVLLKNAICYDADVSSCCSDDCDSSNSGKITILKGESVMKAHILATPQGANQSPCNKVFSKNLFVTIRFPSTRAYEDTKTIYKLLMKCKALVFQDTTFYHYVHRENSTMTQKFGIVKFSAIDAYSEMYKDYSLYYPKLSCLVKTRLVGAIMYCLGESLNVNNHETYEKISNDAIFMLKSLGYRGLGLKQMFFVFLMRHAPVLYKFLYKIKN